jgi:hypothetical protein
MMETHARPRQQRGKGMRARSAAHVHARRQSERSRDAQMERGGVGGKTEKRWREGLAEKGEEALSKLPAYEGQEDGHGR